MSAAGPTNTACTQPSRSVRAGGDGAFELPSHIGNLVHTYICVTRKGRRLVCLVMTSIRLAPAMALLVPMVARCLSNDDRCRYANPRLVCTTSTQPRQ